MISEDVIQRIKQENDIVDVISEDIKLRRAGSNYFGLCPFHHEKSPSFSVSQTKQIFKCFGCGEAGNVISYVMKTRKLTFPEAIKLLADRVNITINFQNNDNENKLDKKIYAINKEIGKFFFYNLLKNKEALKYLFKRNLNKETIKRFGIGYASNSWDEAINYLKHKGYTQDDMISAGIVVKGKEGKIFDRFRNRIMFPVFNYKGDVIGFGGRVLDNSKPKYLNTPETYVFKKGINLYGLNYAIKNNIKFLIIVEGYMDCITLHQYGIKNAVASLGTALTINQARLLKRYSNDIIISYDSDVAGQMATMRGLHILQEAGLNVKILTIPKGKDPDEFVKSKGRDEYLKLAQNALPLVDYKIKIAKKDFDFKDYQKTVKYAQKVINIIKELNPVEIDLYIRKLAEDTKIKSDTLYEQLKEMKSKNQKGFSLNSTIGFGQKLYLEPAYIKAERLILKSLLSKNNTYEDILKDINEDVFILDSHRRIYKLILETNNIDDPEKRENYIELNCRDTDTAKEWINILSHNIVAEKEKIENVIRDSLKMIKKFKIEKSKTDIMNKIKKYEEEGNIKESIKLSEELIKVQQILSSMH